MLLLPVHTPLIRPGDHLASLLYKEGGIEQGDIIVLSSKAVAAAESAFIDLSRLSPSPKAAALSAKTGRSPAFCEAVLRELRRLHGEVINTCPGAALTDVRPDGLPSGSILTANAGLDESNVPKGQAIGWPRDPVMSVRRLREELEQYMRNSSLRVTGYENLETRNSKPATAVILTDSCCTPRRHGVTAIALACSGIDPLESMKGQKDLFGKPLQITTEAIADQIATAGNFLMGNAGQSVPAVLLRDHGLTLSDWEGWVPGIAAEEDLFQSL